MRAPWRPLGALAVCMVLVLGGPTAYAEASPARSVSRYPVLGNAKVLSARDAPFEAVIPVSGTTAAAKLRVKTLSPQDYPVNVRMNAEGNAVELSSSYPVPDHTVLSVRIHILTSGMVFAATYRFGSVLDMSARTNGFAGQITSPNTEALLGLSNARGPRYGPTRKSESLLDVAGRLRGMFSAPVGRIATAVFNANRAQFSDTDPRQLRPGVMLKVPSRVDIALVPADEGDRMEAYLSGTRSSYHHFENVTPSDFGVDPAKVAAWVTEHLDLIYIVLGGILFIGLGTRVIDRLRKRHARLKRAHIVNQETRKRFAVQTPPATSAPAIRRVFIGQLEARLKQAPSNVSLRLRLAREYLSEGRVSAYQRLMNEAQVPLTREQSSQRKRLDAQARSIR